MCTQGSGPTTRRAAGLHLDDGIRRLYGGGNRRQAVAGGDYRFPPYRNKQHSRVDASASVENLSAAAENVCGVDELSASYGG